MLGDEEKLIDKKGKGKYISDKLYVIFKWEENVVKFKWVKSVKKKFVGGYVFIVGEI